MKKANFLSKFIFGDFVNFEFQITNERKDEQFYENVTLFINSLEDLFQKYDLGEINCVIKSNKLVSVKHLENET